MTPPMPHQMFFSRECFSTVHTIIRSLRFNAHMKFNVSVQMFSPTVSFGTTLVGTMQQSLSVIGAAWMRLPLVMSVGVERIQDSH